MPSSPFLLGTAELIIYSLSYLARVLDRKKRVATPPLLYLNKSNTSSFTVWEEQSLPSGKNTVIGPHFSMLEEFK